MKKSAFMIIGLLSAAGTFAQTKSNKTIPAEVQKAFSKQNPIIRSVK